jgi:hypothetical protein
VRSFACVGGLFPVRVTIRDRQYLEAHTAPLTLSINKVVDIEWFRGRYTNAMFLSSNHLPSIPDNSKYGFPIQSDPAAR